MSDKNILMFNVILSYLGESDVIGIGWAGGRAFDSVVEEYRQKALQIKYEFYILVGVVPRVPTDAYKASRCLRL